MQSDIFHYYWGHIFEVMSFIVIKAIYPKWEILFYSRSYIESNNFYCFRGLIIEVIDFIINTIQVLHSKLQISLT
jgi:hypothetical protein